MRVKEIDREKDKEWEVRTERERKGDKEILVDRYTERERKKVKEGERMREKSMYLHL